MNIIPVLEAIDHMENSPLGVELEIEIGKLRKFKNVSDATIGGTKIAKIIKQYTGLSVVMKVGVYTEAAVTAPDINKGNPIINTFMQYALHNKDGDVFLAENNMINGSVNLRTGKVTGDFSKGVSVITLGEMLIWKSSTFTVRETTALLLHEIGHLFVYMEMVGRTTRTNYILNEGVNRLIGSNTKEQRIIILRAIEDEYGNKFEHIDALAERSKHPDIYRVAFMQLAVKESINHIGNNIYNTRVYEQLSDTFAVRHGYARDLATGLDKIYRAIGDKAYNSKARQATYSVVRILTMGSLFITGGVVGGYIVGMTLAILLLSNPLDGIYDPLPKRIKKMKHQLRDGLKDRSISKSRKQTLVTDLKLLDQLTDQMLDNEDVLEFILKRILPHGRKQESMIVIQERLEEMLNNKLFAAAAALELGE